MTPDEFQFFADFLRKQSGISIDIRKEYLVEARIVPLAREMGLSNLSALVSTLRAGTNGTLGHQIVDRMTTNETSFFRDIRPFETLTQYVIPSLLEKHATERELHIWSAACSSGQEPYSIAMQLRESFPELADWTVKIIATDLSDTALVRAREGSYSQLEVNRGLPSNLLKKYFTRSGVRWEIKKTIRDMVDFRQLNLIVPDSDFPSADVAFVRNVLIYFERDLQRNVLARLHDRMSIPSFLFLGGSETTVKIDERFEVIDDLPRTGCYRVKEG